MARKSAVPDDVMYKNFTMACVFVAKGKHVRAVNACVRCKEDSVDPKYGYPSHCSRCGWNSEVKMERLTKMVGEKQALELIAQSEDISLQTRKKISENGDYPYV